MTSRIGQAFGNLQLEVLLGEWRSRRMVFNRKKLVYASTITQSSCSFEFATPIQSHGVVESKIVGAENILRDYKSVAQVRTTITFPRTSRLPVFHPTLYNNTPRKVSVCPPIPAVAMNICAPCTHNCLRMSGLLIVYFIHLVAYNGIRHPKRP